MERSQSVVTLNLLIFLFSGLIFGALSPFYIRLFGIHFISQVHFLLFFSSCLVIGLALGFLAFIINKFTIMRAIRSIATDLKGSFDEEIILTRSIGFSSQDELGHMSYWFNTFIKHLDEKVDNTKQLVSTIRENSLELNLNLHHSADIMNNVSNNLGSIEKLSRDQNNVVRDTGEHFQNFMENFSHITEHSGTLIDNFKDLTYYIRKQNTLAQDFLSSVDSLKHSLGDQNSGKTNDQLHSDLLGITIQFAKESTRSIDEQVQHFTRIEKLLEEIEDIAESTHLLSINASIEAARAGESGRGFTIVALQIRNLATNSGTLTSEIREQIEAIMTMAKNSGAQLTDLRGILTSRMEDVITDMQLLATCAKDIDKTVERVSSIQGKLKEKVKDMDQELGDTSEVRETLLESMSQLSDYSQKLNQNIDRMTSGSGQMEQITKDFLAQGSSIERQANEIFESVRSYEISKAEKQPQTKSAGEIATDLSKAKAKANG